MADPFSVSAGAISIVSLGIQVCQGLLSYYGDYKSCDASVASLWNRLEDLRSTLKICEEALQRQGLATSRASGNVNQSIRACERGLGLLQANLASLQKAPRPPGLKAKAANYGKQILYPFRKPDILRLQSTVSEMQDNLNTALLALQTDISINQSTVLAAISTNTTGDAQRLRQINDGLQRVELSTQNTDVALPTLQRQSEALSSNLRAMRDDVAFFHQDMKEHHTSVSDSVELLTTQSQRNAATTAAAILTRIDGLAQRQLDLMHAFERQSESSHVQRATLENDVKSIQLSLLQRPSLLMDTFNRCKKESLDEVPLSVVHKDLTNKPQSRTGKSGIACTCRVQKSKLQYSNFHCSETPGSVSLSTAKVDHLHHCPLFPRLKSSWSLEFRVSFCSKLLARAVRAAASLTKGAGGMSLSSNLSFRHRVPFYSPAFAVFGANLPWMTYGNDVEQIFDQRLQTLRQMFQNGEASPYDIDPHGKTLLHRAYHDLGLSYMPSVIHDLGRLNASLRLLLNLIDLGIPLDDVDDGGDSLLNVIINNSAYDKDSDFYFASWVTQLIDRGAEPHSLAPSSWCITVYDAPSKRPHCLDLKRILTTVVDIAKATECNAICLAVLQKCEVSLRQALAIYPDTVNEPNTFGQAAVHLAVDWPAGLRILLEAGADVDYKDYFGASPLDHAVDSSLIEPVQILGAAGCSLLSHYPSRRYQYSLLGHAALVYDSLAMDDKITSAAETVMDLLVDLIVDRRQQLCALAFRTLSASELTQFYPMGFQDSHYSHETASQASMAMLYYGVPIPSALKLGRDHSSVYHSHYMSSLLAEKLWRAGFEHVNSKNSLGLTPLMYVSQNISSYLRPGYGYVNAWLECIAWFIGKGAAFDANHDLALMYDHLGGELGPEPRQLMSATSLQFVASAIGKLLRYIVLIFGCEITLRTVLSKASRREFDRVIEHSQSDKCKCACTVSGCTAFTMMVKDQTKSFPSYRPGKFFSRWADMVEIERISKVPELLRVMTFEKLGLTHTCCRVEAFDYGHYCQPLHYGHYYQPFGDKFEHDYSVTFFSGIKDQTEIDEMREEEAADLQKLEELLIEFEAKRTESDIPFSEFLEQCWEPRMDEVLNEGDLDEKALREIGVMMHRREPSPYDLEEAEYDTSDSSDD